VTAAERQDSRPSRARIDHPGFDCGPRIACWRERCADWAPYRPVELVLARSGALVLILARCHAPAAIRPWELPSDVLAFVEGQAAA
jgi:hypothetical protein